MLDGSHLDWNKIAIVVGGAIFIGLGLLLILTPELILGGGEGDSSNPLGTSTLVVMIPDTGATSPATKTPTPAPSYTATHTHTQTATVTSTATETVIPTEPWIATITKSPKPVPTQPIPTRMPPTSTPISNPTIDPKLCKDKPSHPHYCTPTP